MEKEIKEEKQNSEIEQIQEISEQIKQIKQIPKEVKDKINKKVYENIFIAAVAMAICNMLLLGYMNIEPMRYIIDLKVFSVIALLGTLFMIERAYKKDSSKLAINAVETIVISIVLLALPYIYTYYIYKFPAIIVFISLVFAIYYGIKGIVIIFKEKSNYKKTSNDINDIIK